MWMGKARIASLARQFLQLRSSCPLVGQQQPNRTVNIPRIQPNVKQQLRSYMQRPGGGAARALTLSPEDGIGPLVTGAVVQVLEAKDTLVHFETNEISGKILRVPAEGFESVRKYKLCLKGGLATAFGGGLSSLNDPLRKELHLSSSFVHPFVHCSNLPGLQERHDEVDIVVIVEYADGKYSGLEHEVVHGVVEALRRTYCKVSVQVRRPTSTTGTQ